MNRGAAALAVLLTYGVLTLWIEERWAWGLFQVAVFALAGWRLARREEWYAPLALAPLAAAAAWPLIQLGMGATVSRGPTIDAALNWFTFVMVFAVSCELLSDASTRRRFLGTIAVFGMLLAAVSTVQKYSSGGKFFWAFPSGFPDDVLGPFVSHNQFAAWIELLLPVALYSALAERRLRPLYGSAAAVMFGSVIASASRAGFALACAEILLLGFWARRGTARKTLVIATAQFAALTAVAVAVFGWQGLQHRFEMAGPEAIRVDAVRASLQMVRDKPWTGMGLGTWSIVYPRYAGFDAGLFVNQTHNDWAQWAAEGGLPFVLFMIGFAALLWKPAVQSIYGLGTLAFLLHASVDYPMQQRPGLAAWFFAVAGATIAWRSGPAGDGNGLLRRTGSRSRGFGC